MTERLTLGSATASLTGSGLGTGSGREIVLDRLSGVSVLTACSATGSNGTASRVTVIVTESGNNVAGMVVAANGAGVLGVTVSGACGSNNV